MRGFRNSLQSQWKKCLWWHGVQDGNANFKGARWNNMYVRMYVCRTVSWPTLSSGEGSRSHPTKWQFPGRFSLSTQWMLWVLPVLFTPHCTTLTSEKSYSPRRRFKKDWIAHFTFKTQPKLPAVNLSPLVKCQVRLFLCPLVTYFYNVLIWNLFLSY